MFKRFKSLIIFLFLALCFQLSASSSQAKDYSFPQVDFKVQINSDGSIKVEEKRTYQFNGQFHWADEWINKIPNSLMPNSLKSFCWTFGNLGIGHFIR